MIRAAFDVHVLGQRATGNETYAEGLLRAFREEPARDIELVFYHSQPPGSDSHADFVRISPEWPYIRVPITTPLALRRDRIDVAHFQYFAPPVCSSAIVLTVHDLSFERYPAYFSPTFTRRMRSFMPWMSRHATRVIAVSAATRDDLVHYYGIAPERIDVIHNGTSADFRPHPDRDLLRRNIARLGLTRPFIVCVGNLGRRKNQARVVRAFARLVHERSVDLDLVLIGKEDYSGREVLAEIDHGGVRDRVKVAGFVSREELVALYNLAELSVYASHYEGFGLPIVESMACGTAVVTSSVSCMPEIAGGAALLVDPSDDDALMDGIGRVIEDEDLRQRLRAAGLERARAFTWRDAARHTLDSYRLAAAAKE